MVPEGRAVCSNTQFGCEWHIAGPIDADAWDVVCDLSTLDAVDTIYFTTWL